METLYVVVLEFGNGDNARQPELWTEEDDEVMIDGKDGQSVLNTSG